LLLEGEPTRGLALRSWVGGFVGGAELFNAPRGEKTVSVRGQELCAGADVGARNDSSNSDPF